MVEGAGFVRMGYEMNKPPQLKLLKEAAEEIGLDTDTPIGYRVKVEEGDGECCYIRTYEITYNGERIIREKFSLNSEKPFRIVLAKWDVKRRIRRAKKNKPNPDERIFYINDTETNPKQTFKKIIQKVPPLLAAYGLYDIVTTLII